MKYALLIHQSEDAFKGSGPAAQAAGRAYGEALMAAGVFVAGAGLGAPQSATTVSTHEGKRQVQDGPYAETKEFLAGFAILEVADLDAALDWAKRHPAAEYAHIEVRPLAGSHFATAPPKAS